MYYIIKKYFSNIHIQALKDDCMKYYHTDVNKWQLIGLKDIISYIQSKQSKLADSEKKSILKDINDIFKGDDIKLLGKTKIDNKSDFLDEHLKAVEAALGDYNHLKFENIETANKDFYNINNHKFKKYPNLYQYENKSAVENNNMLLKAKNIFSMENMNDSLIDKVSDILPPELKEKIVIALRSIKNLSPNIEKNKFIQDGQNAINSIVNDYENILDNIDQYLEKQATIINEKYNKVVCQNMLPKLKDVKKIAMLSLSMENVFKQVDQEADYLHNQLIERQKKAIKDIEKNGTPLLQQAKDYLSALEKNFDEIKNERKNKQKQVTQEFKIGCTNIVNTTSNFISSMSNIEKPKQKTNKSKLQDIAVLSTETNYIVDFIWNYLNDKIFIALSKNENIDNHINRILGLEYDDQNDLSIKIHQSCTMGKGLYENAYISYSMYTIGEKINRQSNKSICNGLTGQTNYEVDNKNETNIFDNINIGNILTLIHRIKYPYWEQISTNIPQSKLNNKSPFLHSNNFNTYSLGTNMYIIASLITKDIFNSDKTQNLKDKVHEVLHKICYRIDLDELQCSIYKDEQLIEDFNSLVPQLKNYSVNFQHLYSVKKKSEIFNQLDQVVRSILGNNYKYEKEQIFFYRKTMLLNIFNESFDTKKKKINRQKLDNIYIETNTQQHKSLKGKYYINPYFVCKQAQLKLYTKTNYDGDKNNINISDNSIAKILHKLKPSNHTTTYNMPLGASEFFIDDIYNYKIHNLHTLRKAIYYSFPCAIAQWILKEGEYGFLQQDYSHIWNILKENPFIKIGQKVKDLIKTNQYDEIKKICQKLVNLNNNQSYLNVTFTPDNNIDIKEKKLISKTQDIVDLCGGIEKLSEKASINLSEENIVSILNNNIFFNIKCSTDKLDVFSHPYLKIDNFKDKVKSLYTYDDENESSLYIELYDEYKKDEKNIKKQILKQIEKNIKEIYIYNLLEMAMMVQEQKKIYNNNKLQISTPIFANKKIKKDFDKMLNIAKSQSKNKHLFFAKGFAGTVHKNYPIGYEINGLHSNLEIIYRGIMSTVVKDRNINVSIDELNTLFHEYIMPLDGSDKYIKYLAQINNKKVKIGNKDQEINNLSGSSFDNVMMMFFYSNSFIEPSSIDDRQKKDIFQNNIFNINDFEKQFSTNEQKTSSNQIDWDKLNLMLKCNKRIREDGLAAQHFCSHNLNNVNNSCKFLNKKSLDRIKNSVIEKIFKKPLSKFFQSEPLNEITSNLVTFLSNRNNVKVLFSKKQFHQYYEYIKENIFKNTLDNIPNKQILTDILMLTANVICSYFLCFISEYENTIILQQGDELDRFYLHMTKNHDSKFFMHLVSCATTIESIVKEYYYSPKRKTLMDLTENITFFSSEKNGFSQEEIIIDSSDNKKLMEQNENFRLFTTAQDIKEQTVHINNVQYEKSQNLKKVTPAIPVIAGLAIYKSFKKNKKSEHIEQMANSLDIENNSLEKNIDFQDVTEVPIA